MSTSTMSCTNMTDGRIEMMADGCKPTAWSMAVSSESNMMGWQAAVSERLWLLQPWSGGWLVFETAKIEAGCQRYCMIDARSWLQAIVCLAVIRYCILHEPMFRRLDGGPAELSYCIESGTGSELKPAADTHLPRLALALQEPLTHICKALCGSSNTLRNLSISCKPEGQACLNALIDLRV